MEIAAGIRRLGEGLVNVYLLEEAGEITIVDAGAPGYWKDLPGELATMGRSLDDVRALVLTHAHSDHVGFAERIRRERGVPVSVHAGRRGPRARRGQAGARRARPGYRGWSIRALAGFAVFALTHGMTRVTPIAEVGTFLDGATLDVPGAPAGRSTSPATRRAASPSTSPARDAILVGDAFVTRSVITGRRGPHFHTAFNADHRQASPRWRGSTA